LSDPHDRSTRRGRCTIAGRRRRTERGTTPVSRGLSGEGCRSVRCPPRCVRGVRRSIRTLLLPTAFSGARAAGGGGVNAACRAPMGRMGRGGVRARAVRPPRAVRAAHGPPKPTDPWAVSLVNRGRCLGVIPPVRPPQTVSREVLGCPAWPLPLSRPRRTARPEDAEGGGGPTSRGATDAESIGGG